MPDPTPPDPTPQQLVSFIKDTFSLKELKTLCFDLKIEFDDLDGNTKAEKAQELGEYMRRRGRMADLREKLAHERPGPYTQRFTTQTKPPEEPPTSSDPTLSAKPWIKRVPVWVWVASGLVIIILSAALASPALRDLKIFGAWDDETPNATRVVAVVDETIVPTQTPTATIASTPTPEPTLIPVQSWTNESEFSIVQGWDILVDADGDAGFEDGKFYIANKKKNLLYISLWDELGGNINNAVFSVDLIESGKSEAPNAAGLVFGWTSDTRDSSYAFLVTKEGACEFRQESNNKWLRVSQGQTDNFLPQKASHTVSVVLRGGHAYGFIDEIYCDDFLFPSYESGYIGVAALSGINQEDGSKGYFDNARFATLPSTTSNN